MCVCVGGGGGGGGEEVTWFFWMDALYSHDYLGPNFARLREDRKFDTVHIKLVHKFSDSRDKSCKFTTLNRTL